MADPFPKAYNEELKLQKCMTLLQVYTDTEVVWSGYVENGANRWVGVAAKPTMRRTPVATVNKICDLGFSGSLTVVANKNGAQIRGIGISTLNSGYYTASYPRCKSSIHALICV